MPTTRREPKEYSVSVDTDDVHKAIRLTAGALFAFVEEALAIAAEDDEFQLFAHDILGVLTRHGDQLPEGESAWAGKEGDSLPYD